MLRVSLNLWKPSLSTKRYLHFKGTHSLFLEFNKNPSLPSAISLISRCKREGNVSVAFEIFDSLKKRIIPLNSKVFCELLDVCRTEHDSLLMLKVMDEMEMSSVQPDNISLVWLLKACVNSESADSLRKWLKFLKMNKVFVLTSFNCLQLIQVFARLKCWDDVTSVLQLMDYKKVNVDDYFYNKLLKCCVASGPLHLVQQIFDKMKKSPVTINNYHRTSFITAFGRCGEVNKAMEVFNLVPLENNDLFTWTSMINAFGHNLYVAEAENLFYQMEILNITPDNAAWNALACAYSRTGNFSKLSGLLNDMKKFGKTPSKYVINTLIVSFGTINLSQLNEIRKIIKMMHKIDFDPQIDLVSYHILITTHLKENMDHNALGIFEEMKDKGIFPDEVMWVEIFDALQMSGNLALLKEFHNKLVELVKVLNPTLWTILIESYLICEDVGTALRLFDDIPQDIIHSMKLNNIMKLLKRKPGLLDIALIFWKKLRERKVFIDEHVWATIFTICGMNGDLESLQQIHQEFTSDNHTLTTVLYNSLINSYAKCEDLHSSFKIFKQMPENWKNERTYTIIMRVYSKEKGHMETALNLYFKIREKSYLMNEYILSSLIKICGINKEINILKQIHSSLTKPFGTILFNNLIAAYSECGDFDSSIQIFKQMPQSFIDSTTITTIIRVYSTKEGYLEDALELYRNMREIGKHIDEYLWSSLISICGTSNNLSALKDIHQDMIASNQWTTTILWNSLLQSYCKCGDTTTAIQLFQNIPQNLLNTRTFVIIVSGSNMNIKEVHELFKKIKSLQIPIDEYLWSSLISICGTNNDLEFLKTIYQDMISSDQYVSTQLWNTILQAFCNCNDFKTSYLLFQNMPPILSDTITFGILLMGSKKEPGNLETAFELLKQMKSMQIPINDHFWVCLVSICITNNNLQSLKQIHKEIIESKIMVTTMLSSALINGYSFCGDFETAVQLFQSIPSEKMDSKALSIMLNVLDSKEGYLEDALALYQNMRETVTIDEYVWSSLLSICGTNNNLSALQNIHKDMISSNQCFTTILWCSLLQSYCKCGDFAISKQIFQTIPQPFLCTRSFVILLNKYNQEAGHLEAALQLFEQMKSIPIPIDEYVWTSLISICGTNNNLNALQNIHQDMISSNHNITTILWNSLISSYSKCGEFETSCELFEKMPKHLIDSSTYAIMIGLYGDFRMPTKALSLFDEMRKQNYKIDMYVIGSLLHVYSHALMPDEALKLYHTMQTDYGVVPHTFHIMILIDSLGRVGRLDEAELFSKSNPSEISWTTLLGACRLYNDETRAERVFNEIQKIAPGEVSSYVLLLNIYAALGHWEKHNKLKDEMNDKSLKKIPGKSWIYVNGKKHSFVAHEKNHPSLSTITKFRGKVMKRITKIGYKPDFSWVVKDIPDEEKEMDLCEHSERFALYFAMIEDTSDKPITIFKNLRVCGDCHTHTALVSKAFKREIRLRDSAVWHIFEDGQCSCKNKF